MYSKTSYYKVLTANLQLVRARCHVTSIVSGVKHQVIGSPREYRAWDMTASYGRGRVVVVLEFGFREHNALFCISSKYRVVFRAGQNFGLFAV